MRLTNKDKQFLTACGYLQQDFAQIEKAAKFCKIEKGVKNERIRQKDFIKNWGRAAYLSNLARAAFHFSSSYVPEKNIFYIFDCFNIIILEN